MKGLLCNTKKISPRISVAIALFILFAISLTPITVNAAGNTIKLTVKQSYSASSFSAAETFIYRLKPLDPDSPMPTGSTEEGYRFAISGITGVEVGPVTYSNQGIYYYELWQQIETEKANVIYDRSIYSIEVHVDESLNAYVIVKDKIGIKLSEIVFTNSRDTGGWVDPPTPTPPPIETPPPSESPPPTNPPVTEPPPVSPTPPETVDPTEELNDGRTPSGGATPDTDPDPDEEIIIDDGNPPGSGLEPDDGGDRPGVDSPRTGDDSRTTLDIALFAAGSLLVISALLILVLGKKKARQGD